MNIMIAVGVTVAAALAVGCGDAASSAEATHPSSSGEPVPTRPVPTMTARPVVLRCVDVGRFDATDVSVVDSAARKAWQRDVDPLRRTQSDAAAYCASLGIDSQSGWRLPSVDELASIRLAPSLTSGNETDHCVPSIDQSAFPDTPASEFWTSSTRSGFAVDTDFSDGRSQESDPSATFYVRCVRDIEPSPVDVAASSRAE